MDKYNLINVLYNTYDLKDLLLIIKNNNLLFIKILPKNCIWVIVDCEHIFKFIPSSKYKYFGILFSKKNLDEEIIFNYRNMENIYERKLLKLLGNTLEERIIIKERILALKILVEMVNNTEQRFNEGVNQCIVHTKFLERFSV